MKRTILKVPVGLTLDQLTQAQRDAIEGVFAQFVLPMPGTIEFEGNIITDALVKDNFDPTAIAELELPFTVMGLWQWDGETELVELQALDALFANFIIGGELPHNFAGWPNVIYG